MSEKKKQAWKPLERSVPVVLEDSCLDELDAAREALATAEAKAESERDRLFRLAKTPDMTPTELIDLDRSIAATLDRDVQPLRDGVTAATRKVHANTRTYRLRSLGRVAYRTLLSAHPAREEDHEAARRESGLEQARSQWNDDTFPPALLKACCVDPRLSDADLAAMFEEWNQAQLIEIVAAAVAVNTQLRVAPRN